MIKKTKAIALLSGGLDSIIAAKLIINQGIECIGVFFSTPLWSNYEKEKTFFKQIMEENNFEIKIIHAEDDYIDIIKNPKYGWGKNINPCIDCKIYMMKKAKKLMEELNADFIVTGEVLGQRPMSQHIRAFNLIEKEAGLAGKIVRPLSAKILPLTEAENEFLIEKNKLEDIQGRSRKIQYELAQKFNIKTHGSPAGGCLLTEEKYAKKLKDLFTYDEKPNMNDLSLLKYGRHFRYKGIKIVVGRNSSENEEIIKFNKSDWYLIDVPNYGSPVTLLQATDDPEILNFACQLTVYYSDCKLDEALVKYTKNNNEKFINIVGRLSKETVNKYNIALN
jgi:tRNA U34 2-thiouridine synthase MnmA/TrmU